MSHHTTKSGYQNLSQRLNKFPLGAPATKSLYKVLEVLFFSQRGSACSPTSRKTISGPNGCFYLETIT